MSAPPATPALHALLAGLPERLPTDRVDRAWVFPPREVAGQESGLVAVSLRPEAGSDPQLRQLVTVRYQAPRTRGAAQATVEVTEQGWAPADRLPRVIGGVVARLNEPDDPFEWVVEGDPARWSELVRLAGGGEVDRPNGE